MSKALREAFKHGVVWADTHPAGTPGSFEVSAEALDFYPDRPCATVRDIVVQWLKDNGYDGLYCPDSTCFCNPGTMRICAVMPTCRPGVLVDGKIVERGAFALREREA